MKRRLRIRRKGFTLIELIVSMAVFSILMLALMTFFNEAQQVFTGTSARNRQYENARIALDFITRDLQSAVYDGDKLLFWQNTANTLNFISAVPTKPQAATSNLCEIRYQVDQTAGSNYWLQRSQIADNDANWDFKTSTGTGAWNDSDFHNLIPYVLALEFKCKNAAGADISPNASAVTAFPASVIVDITVMDKASFDKWRALDDGGASNATDFKNKNKRTFSKTIFLNSRYQGI